MRVLSVMQELMKRFLTFSIFGFLTTVTVVLAGLFPDSARAVAAEKVAAAQEGQFTVDFQPLADFSRASKYVFDKQSGYISGGGLALFTVAREFDGRARDYFAGQHRTGEFEWWGNEILGTGVPGAFLGAGIWTWGHRNRSAYNVHAGQAELEALFATGVVSAILKGTVRRERPDGSDRYSFPSAHTSTMAAASMALQEFYGWRIGVPAFVLTALTAVGRISADKHWLSDTIGGATVGMVCAHAVASAHFESLGQSLSESSGEPTAAIELMILSPLDGSNGIQILASREF